MVVLIPHVTKMWVHKTIPVNWYSGLMWRRLAYVDHVARARGMDGHSARWLMNFDCASSVQRHRHALMLLADVAVLLQNGSPYVDRGLQNPSLTVGVGSNFSKCFTCHYPLGWEPL